MAPSEAELSTLRPKNDWIKNSQPWVRFYRMLLKNEVLDYGRTSLSYMFRIRLSRLNEWKSLLFSCVTCLLGLFMYRTSTAVFSVLSREVTMFVLALTSFPLRLYNWWWMGKGYLPHAFIYWKDISTTCLASMQNKLLHYEIFTTACWSHYLALGHKLGNCLAYGVFKAFSVHRG